MKPAPDYRHDAITAAGEALQALAPNVQVEPATLAAMASAAYDAIAPVVRHAFAEEAAQAIEAYVVDFHPVGVPPSIAWEAGRSRAATIAREIGGIA